MPYATYRFNKIIAAETIRFIVTVAIVVYKGLKLVVYRMLTLNFTGRLFSQEHNRWFSTDNTPIQIMRDTNRRLTIAVNRIPFGQWFSEQYEKLRQTIRQPIQPKKSSGIKL